MSQRETRVSAIRPVMICTLRAGAQVGFCIGRVKPNSTLRLRERQICICCDIKLKWAV